MNDGLLEKPEHKALAFTLVTFFFIFMGYVLVKHFSHLSPEEYAQEVAGTEVEGVTKETARALTQIQEEVKQAPEDIQSNIVLGYYYLQAFRENQDPSVLERIMSIVRKINEIEPDHEEATFLLGMVASKKKDFKTSLTVAQKLVSENPAVPRYLGLLADSQIELGQYDDAVETVELMHRIQPDFNSVVRTATLRQIFGDLQGAANLMRESLKTFEGGRENKAWGITQLARLTLPLNVLEAKEYFETSLDIYPNYAPALAGLAKVAFIQDDTEKAKQLLQQSLEIAPSAEYAITLGDIYFLEDASQQAEAYYQVAETIFEEHELLGIDQRFEQAKFWLDHNRNVDEALVLAQLLFADRPTLWNTDLLAWALYKNGEPREAALMMEEALNINEETAEILFHAGMIALAFEADEKAEELFETAFVNDPYFSILYHQVLEEALGGE